MQELLARSFTDQLRDLAAELCSLDHDLKSNPPLDEAVLRDFRWALDNVRMTAWTVNELLNARRSQKNPQAAISFLTGERLRHFSQMVRILADDFEQSGTSWPAEAMRDLANSFVLLRERLGAAGEIEQAGKAGIAVPVSYLNLPPSRQTSQT
jgi:hypothetical protein